MFESILFELGLGFRLANATSIKILNLTATLGLTFLEFDASSSLNLLVEDFL